MTQPEFLQLIDRYLAGNASVEEEQLLLNFFDSFQEDIEWDEKLFGLKQHLEDKMLQRLQAAVKKGADTGTVKVFSIAKALKKVAAVLIGLTFITGIFVYKAKKAADLQSIALKKNAVKFDAEPGQNKATLTLADGSKLELNSAKIGVLAKAGHMSVEKTKDGQLIYLIAPSKNADANTPIAFNTISTPIGGQYQVILPDGTKVWLNAASSLKYPTLFKGGQRTVELTGEAYFEVTKNAAMPFYVKVNDMQVKVLGTHFNIMAYHNEPAVKTTLLEGSVQLSSGGVSNKLKPGQQGMLKNGQITVSDVNAEHAIAWKNGYFEFNRSGIHEIMNQLARWYDIEIAYEGNIPDDEFVGKIERSAKLSQVLNILKLSKIHFVLENKKLIVKP
ncbi:FecR domain-containing protein [Mucilaginibacter rigui]|uniref:FecR domain-containing protein n=1 Tax=Mucilaginibacter rigui TaxID=534635 RepID=A0ABR7X217_9SPHI|nr:FecR family protein [Mucilaginibacter rigui]MBD1384643.1 FecR domain-containing protein [Mucilaginibacter rigui]